MQDRWLEVAVALYLIATTVSFASTTLLSRAFIEPVRLLALASAIGIVVVRVLLRLKLGRTTILGAVVYIMAVCYGIALAAANGGIVHVTGRLFTDVALTLTGIVLFSSVAKGIMPRRTVLLYLFFVMGIFALTIAVGGFSVAYPPMFNFEYVATEAGTDVYYSQGISKFFGLGAVAAIYLAFSDRSRLRRLAFLGICAGALCLSLIGGARGDSVAAAVIVLAYSVYRSPSSLLGWAALIGAAVLMLQGTVFLDDFMIFNRLLNIQEGAGIRETLLRQAIQVLLEQPVCLTVGCGFGFFQTYFNYEAGFYPHNVLLEAVVVWGLPIVLVTAMLAVLGGGKYLHRASPKDDAFMLFFAYFVLVFLKSGTVLAAWFVVAGGVNFLAIALRELFWRQGASVAGDRAKSCVQSDVS